MPVAHILSLNSNLIHPLHTHSHTHSHTDIKWDGQKQSPWDEKWSQVTTSVSMCPRQWQNKWPSLVAAKLYFACKVQRSWDSSWQKLSWPPEWLRQWTWKYLFGSIKHWEKLTAAENWQHIRFVKGWRHMFSSLFCSERAALNWFCSKFAHWAVVIYFLNHISVPIDPYAFLPPLVSSWPPNLVINSSFFFCCFF